MLTELIQAGQDRDFIFFSVLHVSTVHNTTKIMCKCA